MGCNCGNKRRNVGITRRTQARAPIRQSSPPPPVTPPAVAGMAPGAAPPAEAGQALTADRRRIDSLRRASIRRNLGIG